MALGKIVRQDEVVEVKTITEMYYGQPGIGKSSLGFTKKNPLMLDCDNGAHRSEFRKDIVQVSKWEDISEINEDDVAPYDTIVVDTVGRLLDYLAASIMAANPKMGYQGALTLQGYGQLKAQFAAWVKHLRILGKDVVLIAHDKEEKRGDDTVIRPDIQGGSYGEVFKIADAVGYLYAGEKGKVLDFNPTPSWEGKNTAHLDPILIPSFHGDPSFGADITAKIKEAINEQSKESKMLADIVGKKRGEYEKLKTAKAFNQAREELNTLPDIAKHACKRVLWLTSQEKGFVFDKKTDKFKAPPKSAKEKEVSK